MATQAVGKNSTTTNTIGSGDGWNPSASNCVIILFQLSAGTPSSVTDSASNTYTLLNTQTQLRLYATVTTASVTSITVTGAANNQLIAIEDDSIITAGYYDGSNILSNTVTGTWTTASVTTTNINDVGYAGIYLGNAVSTFTATAPWTAISGSGLTSGYIQYANTATSLFVCTNSYTATGTYSASGTDNQGSSTHRSVIGFFKQPVGPPPPLSLMQNLGYTTFYVQDH